MKNTILACTLVLSTFTVRAGSTPALIQIKGKVAQSLLTEMSKMQFEGKDVTSGGIFSISNAKLSCAYRNKNNENHTGTILDYHCAIIDNTNETVYENLSNALSKKLFNAMIAKKFQGADSTLGGVDSYDNVSAECLQRLQEHELYKGTSDDYRCFFTDGSN